jgi:uncharacterized membrane protein YqhA
MSTLIELKKSIIDNGLMDDAELKQLQEALYAEGEIDREKADLLFELVDVAKSKSAHKKWETFFINTITGLLLEDQASPGEIDDDEAQWLRAKIQHDGKMRKIEHDLLVNLKKKSINFPEILHCKSKYVLTFEAILFGTRFITFLAVLGSVCASIVLFIMSTIQVVKGIIFFVNVVGSEDHKNLENMVALFVASVDGYLFAMILLIFSLGIYELFINKIDVVSQNKDSRPNWLIITSIDDLKSSLGKVILMILIVSFFEYSLNIHYESVKDLLFLGIGILLIAAALFLTHAPGKHAEEGIHIGKK